MTLSQWTRESNYRQGCLVSATSLGDAVSGIDTPADIDYYVVITHDCDIANDNLVAEPVIELISARIVEKSNGNFEYAKNPRKLHLAWEGEEDDICLELVSTDKFSLPKLVLKDIQVVSGYSLDQYSRRTLQSWLAARYKRQALPDNLQNRLSKFIDYLGKKGRSNHGSLIGYWVDYHPHEELDEDTPYEFSLSVVFSTDDPEAQEKASALVDDIKESFSGLISKAKKGDVILEVCGSYSEEEFTLRDLRSNDNLRFDYISNKENPEEKEAE